MIKNENSFKIGAFLEYFRAMEELSSQHTKKNLVHSTKPRKSKIPVPFFFFKIDHGLFRVIGLKLVGEPRPVFEIFIF